VYKNSVINQTELLIPSSFLSPGLNIVEINTDTISTKVKVLKNN